MVDLKGVVMLRIVEKWNDAELVYDEYGYHLRVYFGNRLRSINVTAEDDDEAIKRARRAIYLFLS